MSIKYPARQPCEKGMFMSKRTSRCQIKAYQATTAGLVYEFVDAATRLHGSCCVKQKTSPAGRPEMFCCRFKGKVRNYDACLNVAFWQLFR